MRRVHYHREERVVAIQSKQVDECLLAEVLAHAPERRVADRAPPDDFEGEVVDERLVVGHPRRPVSHCNRLDYLRIDAKGHGDRRMDRPLDLLVPLARDQQNHELRQSLAECTAIAQVLAHPLRASHRLGTALQRHERTVQRAARTVYDRVGRKPLRIRQRVGRQRRQPVGRHSARIVTPLRQSGRVVIRSWPDRVNRSGVANALRSGADSGKFSVTPRGGIGFANHLS